MTPLPVLASGILSAHKAFLATAASALEYAKQAGELLSEAKAQLPHGEWLPWLEAQCPSISARVAQGYMRIAREWPKLLDAAAQNETAVSYLPIRDALTILADGWTDPGELGPGGADADVEASDDGDGGCVTGTDSLTKTFRLFFTVETLTEFKGQLKELRLALHTGNDTDTVRQAIRLVHDALSPSHRNAKDDDANNPAHQHQLDV